MEKIKVPIIAEPEKRGDIQGITDAASSNAFLEEKEGLAATDLIEHAKAMEALRERERLLQTVIDGSTSPIFLKDLDGKFITINASLERMLGISREEIKGKTDYDIAPKEVADYWRTHDKQVMATRQGHPDRGSG